MKTIRPITENEIAKLRAEPQRSLGCFVVGDSVPGHRIDAIIPMRIAARIVMHGNCWRISGWNSGNGFANMLIKGKTRKVHRVVFTLLRGPIPDDCVLDHLVDVCHFRDCCNPWHLEPVSVKENTERGKAFLFAPKQKAPPLFSDRAKAQGGGQAD